jgi:hypothetical protein
MPGVWTPVRVAPANCDGLVTGEVNAMTEPSDRVPIEPQSIVTPLSRAATLLG